MRAGISAAVADPAKAMAEVASRNRFMTVPSQTAKNLTIAAAGGRSVISGQHLPGFIGGRGGCFLGSAYLGGRRAGILGGCLSTTTESGCETIVMNQIELTTSDQNVFQ